MLIKGISEIGYVLCNILMYTLNILRIDESPEDGKNNDEIYWINIRKS